MRCAFLALTLTLTLLAAIATSAQTYTPKTIRIEGVPAADVPDLLRIAAIQPGTLTKEQIEAALQRIGDTGLFDDLSYTVNANALTLVLKASATNQALPVRFGNLVWFAPGELESLLEARVPAYHGKLPLAGTLTDQISEALTKLLKAKGIDAKVITTQTGDLGAPPTAVTLAVSRPQVLLGDIHVEGASLDAAPQIIKLQGLLGGQEFDLQGSPTIIDRSVEEYFLEGGFLDVTAAPPTFGPPRKDPPDSADPDRYLVDVSIPIRGGELYRISGISLHAAPPVAERDLFAALKIHAHDPASTYQLNVARADLSRLYNKSGYWDADLKIDKRKDPATHTIAYDITPVPGTQYRAGAIDTSALTPALSEAFAKAWHNAPGDLFDEDFSRSLQTTLNALGSPKPLQFNFSLDHHSRIATIRLVFAPPAPHR